MKKKNIILMLLLVFSISFNNRVYAVKTVNTKNTTTGGNSSTTGNTNNNELQKNNCKLDIVQNTSIRIRMKLSADEKYGYLYTFEDSAKNQLFCLDPGKHGTNYYNVSSEINKLDITNPKNAIYYAIYGWYDDFKKVDKNRAVLFAQAAFWYVSTTAIPTYNGAVDTIYSVLMSKECYSHESEITRYLDSIGVTGFTCKRFNTDPNSVEGKRGNGSDKIFKMVRGTPTPFIYKDYLELFTENKFQISGNASLYDIHVANDNYAKDLANSLFGVNGGKAKIYSGELYIWRASNGGDFQRLIGLGGCPSTVDPRCKTDVTTLKNKYSEDKRNKTNLDGTETEYYKKLKELANKYSDIKVEWLDNANFIKNPSCNFSPRGNPTPYDCNEMLDVLLSKPYNSQDYNTQFNTMSQYQDQGKITGFNKNKENPSCDEYDDGPNNPVCLPSYENRYCNMYDRQGLGFLLKDSEDERCWKNGIAYKTESGITVSSKIESGTMSSPYCTVYCREEFGTDFPGGIKDIKAGQAFFWGVGTKEDGYFGNVNANRTCVTTNINYAQFESDWNANENNVLNAYNQYVADKRFNSKGATRGTACHTAEAECATTRSGQSCPAGFIDSTAGCIKFKNAASDYDNRGNCKIGNKTKLSIPSQNFYDNFVCITEKADYITSNSTACASCNGNDILENGHCYKSGHNYTKTAETYGNATVAAQTKCIADSIQNQDEYAKNNIKAPDTDAHENTLKSLLNNREKLSNKIMACQSELQVNNNSIYKFNSSLNLQYTDIAGVNRNIDGVGFISNTDDIVANFSSSGTATGIEVVGCTDIREYVNKDSYLCGGGTTCQIGNRYSDYTWNYSGYKKYYYNNQNYFWKFVRETGIAVNVKSESSYNLTTTPFYNGYYGFIAAFSLKTGFYFPAVVTVTGFGSNNDGNENHFDSYASETIGNPYEYKCPFHVENKIYGTECHYKCDFNTYTCELTADSPAYCKTGVKGLDLVYRVIQLDQDVKVSFPGLLGTGRKQGTNWADFITNNTDKFNKIMDFSKVYSKPIYSIDLTPTLIGEIRRDNIKYRNNKKDPYTSFTDENNQKKIICSTTDSSVNKTCASEYLSTLIKKGYLTGTYTAKSDTKERLAYIASVKNN